MSVKQPVISGKQLVKLLEHNGFKLTRVNGSHPRKRHSDGRVTTVPVHKNDDLPKGLLRTIVSEDLGLEMDAFVKLVKEKK